MRQMKLNIEALAVETFEAVEPTQDAIQSVTETTYMQGFCANECPCISDPNSC
jgi:hypothetical protein